MSGADREAGFFAESGEFTPIGALPWDDGPPAGQGPSAGLRAFSAAMIRDTASYLAEAA
jgi:hypothetical protein